MELLEDIVHDRLLVLHREHPDAEVLCPVLLAELLAGKTEQGERDLIAKLLVVMLCDLHRLIVEQ